MSTRKREKRKQERKRVTSGSPYRLAGNRGEVEACYINRNWKEQGKASIHLLRRVPGGGLVLGSFLVDLWCMGLKDAWGRLDMSLEEFRVSVLERSRGMVELVRVDLETVRWIVAGGIRFARQNGFLLPPRHERWTALLGPGMETLSADMSRFGVDGKLRYVGEMGDLEKRLMGSTVAEFLQRKDVEFVVDDSPGYASDDETFEAAEEVLGLMSDRMLIAVREWCFVEGRLPHPRLAEAVELVAESLTRLSCDPDEAPPEKTARELTWNMGNMLALCEPGDQVELSVALDQVHAYMMQFESAAAFAEAIGWEVPEEED